MTAGTLGISHEIYIQGSDSKKGRKETGGRKEKSEPQGPVRQLTKYLTSVSLESPTFDQQETEPQ